MTQGTQWQHMRGPTVHHKNAADGVGPVAKLLRGHRAGRVGAHAPHSARQCATHFDLLPWFFFLRLLFFGGINNWNWGNCGINIKGACCSEVSSHQVTVTSVYLPPFVSRRRLSNTNQRLPHLCWRRNGYFWRMRASLRPSVRSSHHPVLSGFRQSQAAVPRRAPTCLSHFT